MRKKTTLILPAYNAAKTLKTFLNKIPKSIFDEIILVDDSSSDNTLQIAKKIKGIKVYKTDRNLGYGGNLKMCFSLALENGADVIVELHPDGEYLPDGILAALSEVEKGADLVLGDRFAGRSKGMYWWKNIFTRFLSFVDNQILGTNIPDIHQGFRVYTKKSLEKIDYRSFSNSYLFSFEIIFAAVSKKMKIVSVPVSTNYKGKRRGASLANSAKYTLSTFYILFKDLMLPNYAKLDHKFSGKNTPHCPFCEKNYFVRKKETGGKYSVFFCDSCEIGFTTPQENDLKRFYPSDYWTPPGFMGKLKSNTFGLFQKRRASWVKNYLKKGNILDIGSGEGRFAKDVGNEFEVLSLDPYVSSSAKEVIRKDFLKFKTTNKYDAITFWESLEHVPDAKAYLEKARKILKEKGLVFIECPRYGGLEAKIFGKNWFHIDMPRHTFHFQKAGLERFLVSKGFEIVDQKNVLAFEYGPWGVLASILSVLGVSEKRTRKNFFWVLLVFPLILVGIVFTIVEYIFGQSAIMLVVARKTKINENKKM